MPPKKQVEEKKAPLLGRLGTNLKVLFLYEFEFAFIEIFH